MKSHPALVNSRRRRGFTLVEIMIVVMIIGILLAIAIPTWVSRQSEARYSTVIADLKAIESAKTRYMMQASVDGSAVPVQTDLVPTYLNVWPQGPFHNPSDYVANAVSSPATFKGFSLDDMYNDKATAISTLGL